jgi:site-specific DNA-cytosine methylase
MSMKEIKEFHLFAGIGGGIYGGKLLGHHCCGGVEIDQFCTDVLKQRQKDGWLEPFEIYGDLTKLDGTQFRGTFDVLCGGFPCQAFSHAAHGKNIAEKNLWGEMFRFVQESEAPVVFGENVTEKAIMTAKKDLESVGYTVEACCLSCEELGADHRRNRYWLLAFKNREQVEDMSYDGVLSFDPWTVEPDKCGTEQCGGKRRQQLKAIGNAQSPVVAATAFVILVNRHKKPGKYGLKVCEAELSAVYRKQKSWIREKYGDDFGLVHTPTTMANYSAKSMMKHQGCRNFVTVFDRPSPLNAEWLMGFPIGASYPGPVGDEGLNLWKRGLNISE